MLSQVIFRVMREHLERYGDLEGVEKVIAYQVMVLLDKCCIKAVAGEEGWSPEVISFYKKISELFLYGDKGRPV